MSDANTTREPIVTNCVPDEKVREFYSAAKSFLVKTDPFRNDRSTEAELDARYRLVKAMRDIEYNTDLYKR